MAPARASKTATLSCHFAPDACSCITSAQFGKFRTASCSTTSSSPRMSSDGSSSTPAAAADDDDEDDFVPIIPADAPAEEEEEEEEEVALRFDATPPAELRSRFPSSFPAVAPDEDAFVDTLTDGPARMRLYTRALLTSSSLMSFIELSAALPRDSTRLMTTQSVVVASSLTFGSLSATVEMTAVVTARSESSDTFTALADVPSTPDTSSRSARRAWPGLFLLVSSSHMSSHR